MATLREYKKLGGGRAVISFAESIIKEREFELLWCKGRNTVQGYYEKLGFRAYGEVFDYPPLGPNIIMYKNIK